MSNTINEELMGDDKNAYEYLTKSAAHSKLYERQGFLSSVTIDDKVIYNITPKGLNRFSGSNLVNDWVSNNN